jgi:arginyl-tRNA synthetase
MLNLKEALAADIRVGIAAAFPAVDVDSLTVPINRPDNSEHGDYASPVALALTKQAGKPPMAVVEEIAKHMPKKEYIGRLTAAAPGFLNVRLNPSWLTARLDDVVEADIGAEIKTGEGKSANLEFISANPTGPLTLGNIRTAFSVDTLGNVLECAGYDVTREYYFNDAGAQVKKLGESVLRRYLIAQGHELEYPEDLYQGEYITEVAQQVAEKLKEDEGKDLSAADLTDEAVLARVSREAVTILLSEIKRMIREDLKISFDVWTSEEELRRDGTVAGAIEALREKGYIYQKDGAEYLKTSVFGDDQDRVVVKSDGEYAYIAPDIGYHRSKYERGFDEIFTFVGADHQGHLPKLTAAMKILDYDTGRLHLVAAQWLRVVRDGKPVKLSKRAGQIVTPADLIAEVGYDAARFFMVQHSLTGHMDFDLDLAKERSERNPVYYVQYAYVRLQSILRRAQQQGALKDVSQPLTLPARPALTHTFELDLMRQLYRLPEVIADIATTFEVHQLAYYALDLARAVHVFYRNVPVLAADDTQLVASRLQLVLAARTVLEETLDLLGLSKPDVM